MALVSCLIPGGPLWLKPYVHPSTEAVLLPYLFRMLTKVEIPTNTNLNSIAPSTNQTVDDADDKINDNDDFSPVDIENETLLPSSSDEPRQSHTLTLTRTLTLTQTKTQT